MPIGFLERVAKQKKVPLKDVEDLWAKAKQMAHKALKVSHGDTAPGLEATTTSIFLNMLHLNKFSQSETSESRGVHRSPRQQKKIEKALVKMREEKTDGKGGSFNEGAPQWWQDFTHDQQVKYLDDHPNSKMSKEMDEHIQKSVEKKTKAGGLSDKEKEIAAKHYEAKQREKDGPAPDSDELVDAKVDEKKADKEKISLKDAARDFSHRKGQSLWKQFLGWFGRA